MTGKEKLSTKRPALPVTPRSLSAELVVLSDESLFQNCAISEVDLSYQNSDSVTFESAKLDKVRLSNSEQRRLVLRDVLLNLCDLSNAMWTEGRINRAEFMHSKFIEAKISDCRFEGCIGDLVEFQGSQFKNSIFKDCKLRGCDFRFCDLEGTRFDNCDLESAIFYDAKLTGVDFRRSQLMGIKAHPADLKGAIIDEQQAYDLSRHLAGVLGIEVKDS
jgi:uncharacterized protein YjbI with pentapeptide repeats